MQGVLCLLGTGLNLSPGKLAEELFSYKKSIIAVMMKKKKRERTFRAREG